MRVCSAGSIDAGTVKNVVMEGVQITSNQIHGRASAGGVAGYSWGTIENCSVSGSVSGTVYVGGVVGAQMRRFHHRMQFLCHSEGNGRCRRRGRSDEFECHPDRLLCHRQRDHRNGLPKRISLAAVLVGMNAGSSLLACYATGNVTSTGSSTGYMHIGGFLWK